MAIKQRITAEELWKLPDRDGMRYELVRGEVVEVPGAGGLHSVIGALVYDLISAFVKEHRLGRALPDGAAYILGRHPDLVRVPDGSFISSARMPTDGIPDSYWPMAPDLAVEVVSPHDRASDIHDKVHEYLEAGTRQVWVFWPKRRALTVHTPDETRELGPDDTINGGDVLPGFQVEVAAFFAV